ncbi:MAG TPA: putative glycoside hydrolase [Candidatus Deferrimicrobium sp.]|nr:putative glycoside hydrolase [Candidatus Deferrimicrobium sp.]
MKTSNLTFMCITLIVVCLVFSGIFASGPGGSAQRHEDKSTLKPKGLEVKPSGIWEGWYDAMNGRVRNNSYSSSSAPGEEVAPIAIEGPISSPLYTPLQRQIKTCIYFGGLYYQWWNYIPFYANNYDMAILGDYAVNWDTSAPPYTALSVCLKNANGNIKLLHGANGYLYNPYGGLASAYAIVENNESWFLHAADQDGNELPLTFENRLILAQKPPNFESMYYLMNPVNSGWQDFMADFSKYLMDHHPQLDGMFLDWAVNLRVDLWCYVIPCEAQTTESGATGDIVIKLNCIPSKIAYQDVKYTMVKVFDNPNCQGTDLFAANDGGFIVGNNKEIHLNPNDPDCPPVGTQVWVKYAAKGNPPTYAVNNWTSGLTQLFTKVKNSIGTKLLISNAGEASFERYYYEGVDGFMSEGFIMGGYPHICGPTKSRWDAQLADLVDSENRGKHFMAGSGIAYSDALTCEIFLRLRLFCYASFLLGIDKTAGHDSNASFMFLYHDAPDDTMYNPQYYPEWDLPIGYALGPYCVDSATGLYVRHFSNGIVLVNPYPPLNCSNACNPQDPNRKVYQLNGTYYNYEGQAMTSVTLIPSSGAVLVQSLGNYVVPDLLEDCKGRPGYRGCDN